MTPVSVKREWFTISLTYFKDTGKLYTSATFNREFRASGPHLTDCYMPDVTAYIRGLRQTGEPGRMPGLSEQSVGWDGYILVDCEEGYPCLILPEEK